MVELKGTAEAEHPIVSFLTEQPCVHFTWSVAEHWSKSITETYKDDHGRAQTRTRHESGWTTVAQSCRTLTSFYLQDDYGTIQIQPDGSKLEPMETLNITCGKGAPLYYQKGPSESVAHSDNRRRFIERIIPLHSPLYVVGHARERQDIVAPEIAADPASEIFLISTKSAECVTSGYRLSFWGLGILGLLIAIGGCLLRIHLLEGDPATVPGQILAVVAIYLTIWIMGWGWMVYNSMVSLRERVRQAWANLDVQLKRRNDLIPMLLATCTTLRDHEQCIQNEIAHLRKQISTSALGRTCAVPQSCASSLPYVLEKYPELKVNQAFLSLQHNLIDTEQRIGLARSYFNDIATFYNTRLTIFPDRFIAVLGTMPAQVLMTTSEYECGPRQISSAEED